MRKTLNAFTLIELLIVMSIMLILVTLSKPALSGMLGAFQINQAGQEVAGTIALARQEAVKRNREVEVRFYQVPTSGTMGGTGSYRGMQLWSVNMDPTKPAPVKSQLTDFRVLPNAIMISDNSQLSPLLTSDAQLSGTVSVGSYKNLPWKGFRIRSNGQLSPTITTGSAGTNYLTVVRQTDTPLSGRLVPANYFLLQVNPVTGAVMTYRP